MRTTTRTTAKTAICCCHTNLAHSSLGARHTISALGYTTNPLPPSTHLPRPTNPLDMVHLARAARTRRQRVAVPFHCHNAYLQNYICKLLAPVTSRPSLGPPPLPHRRFEPATLLGLALMYNKIGQSWRRTSEILAAYKDDDLMTIMRLPVCVEERVGEGKR